MWKDPIVEEVRKNRDTLAAQFNYDLAAIFADLRQREKLHKGKLVSFVKPSKKRKVPVHA